MASVRVANVIYDGADKLAIEHNGALVDADALEMRMDLESSPARFAPEANTFRQRVFSLGLAGLDELLACLDQQPPPADTVLARDRCLFLAPTIPTATLLEFDVRADDRVPRYRWRNGRCLKGHDAPLSIPADEPNPQMAVEIAAILGKDVRDATVEQAARAIIGYAPLTLWTFPSRERISTGWGQDRLGQLGPFLVSPAEPFDPSHCSVSITVNDEPVVVAPARRWPLSFAQMIAFASEGCELLAGDVIGSGPIARVSSDGSRALTENDRVGVHITSLGTLEGVIVTGPSRRYSPR